MADKEPLSSRLRESWRGFVKRHIVDDDPMYEEWLRWQARQEWTDDDARAG